MIYPFDDKPMASVGTNLNSVRKHCARWDTAPDPGEFFRSPILPDMVLGPTQDCAVEVVVMTAGSNASILSLDDFANSQNRVRIREVGASIRGALTTSGSGGEQQVQYNCVVGNWYHILVHWQDSHAGTARVELFVDGISIGATPYYAKIPWAGGVGSYVQIGGNFFVNGRITLARYWMAAPPAATLLYDLGYIETGVYAELACQWDMGPGYGNTALDSIGLPLPIFDIPWVGVNQPDAIYSSYRYTGQCRANRWTPP